MNQIAPTYRVFGKEVLQSCLTSEGVEWTHFADAADESAAAAIVLALNRDIAEPCAICDDLPTKRGRWRAALRSWLQRQD